MPEEHSPGNLADRSLLAKPPSETSTYHRAQLERMGLVVDGSGRISVAEVGRACPAAVGDQGAPDQRPQESLEERFERDRIELAKQGIASFTPHVRADRAYRSALGALKLDEPAVAERFRASLEAHLKELVLPSIPMPSGGPGIQGKPEQGHEAIIRVVEWIAQCRDAPSDLQRLLTDQGARSFPLMDEVEVWALREAGEGDGAHLFYEHLFTNSPERDAHLQDAGNKKLYLVRDGVPTSLYGQHRALQQQGALFLSTSQDSLREQDPDRMAFSEDQLLKEAATYAALSRTDRGFLAEHETTIRMMIQRFGQIPFAKLEEVRREEKANDPNLADYMSVATIALYDKGRMVGMVKTKYRMEHLEMAAGARAYEKGPHATRAVRRLVLAEDQRKSGNTDIDHWLVGTLLGSDRLREHFALRDANGPDGAPRFPAPSYSELQGNPDAWHRLHMLNHPARFEASQRLRDWLMGDGVGFAGRGDGLQPVFRGRPDEELDGILDQETRQAILGSLQRRFLSATEADPEEAFIPRHLECVPDVAGAISADIGVVYKRLLMPVMREEFPDELERVEAAVGPQREATREDMAAVTRTLEKTVPDPLAVVAILEAVNAVAPDIVRSLRKDIAGVPAPRAPGDGLRVRSHSPSLVGQTRSKLRIDGVLGEGAMGIVYLATQLDMERPVALKVLSARSIVDPDHQRRFRGEAITGGKLVGNPNVVQVFQRGEEWPLYFIAMEYIDGGTLQDRIDEQKRVGGSLRWEEVRDVLVDAAGALKEMEARGIIHRDIKPDNIMRTGKGTYKLADFGMSFEIGKEQEDPGSIVGTPHFMPSEQIKGGRVDHRADLYALGATAYCALAGTTPYEATDLHALFRLVVDPTEAPDPLARLRPDIPAELVAIVEDLMRQDPEQRLPSAGGLLSDLRCLRSA